MTYKFSKDSLDNLVGVHPVLFDICSDVMTAQILDFSIREGVRTLEKQKEYVAKGVSKTMNSKHLIQPDGYGHAVDLYPHPIDMKAVIAGNWRECSRFALLAGAMLFAARSRKVVLRWGGDWDSDGETLDHTFSDFPHFELVL